MEPTCNHYLIEFILAILYDNIFELVLICIGAISILLAASLFYFIFKLNTKTSNLTKASNNNMTVNMLTNTVNTLRNIQRGIWILYIDLERMQQDVMLCANIVRQHGSPSLAKIVEKSNDIIASILIEYPKGKEKNIRIRGVSNEVSKDIVELINRLNKLIIQLSK